MRRPCQADFRLSATVRPGERPTVHLDPRWRSVRTEHERHEVGGEPAVVPADAERVELPMLESAFERSELQAKVSVPGHGYDRLAVERIRIHGGVARERKGWL